MSSRRGRVRTKYCRNFALGHCPQGENCNYIHASPNSIHTDLNIPPMLGSRPSLGGDSQQSAATLASPVWSTLSPVTNSSDQPNYQWGSSPVSGVAPASRIKYRPLSWRTALCRHFVKNKGWCPLGDRCNYIHDLALAEYAKDDVRFGVRHLPGAGTGKFNGKGKVGSKHSHCWAYVQGLCHMQDCQYLHPVAVRLFAEHTPCLAWPNCRRGPLCPYKHPEPYLSDTPPDTPVLSPESIRPPVEQQDHVPRGAVPINGTMYFPVRSPPPPPPPPQMQQPQMPPPPIPVLNLSPPMQSPIVAPNMWDAWRMAYPPTPLTYMPMMAGPAVWPDNAAIGIGWQESRAPYAPQGLPMLPVPAYEGLSPTPLLHVHAQAQANAQRQAQARLHAQAQAQAQVQVQQGGSHAAYEAAEQDEHSRGCSLPIPDSELPYIPPKQQRVGHARRVSVTIKGKEDLDALALDTTSRGRQPWQTHGDRLGRRSWAPSSTSLHARGAMTPPATLHGI
ncbi:hypothetical protein C8Q70DRAFT_1056632 [Cubamyces menziesii]|nr:hypothetical protein C8Q70DRAFT_1056632 [Cubamyces menziesii]